MKIADIIRMRRKDLGMTLEQVGKIVGVDRSTVRRWEAGGIANMRRDRLAKLAEALQIEPTDLVGEDNTEDPANNYIGIWSRDMVNAYREAPENVQNAICVLLQIQPLKLPNEGAEVE